MFIYPDIYTRARNVLAERRYISPNIRATDLLNQAGVTAWDNSYGTEEERFNTLSPEHQALFNRVAAGFTDPQYDDLLRLEDRAWYAAWEGDSIEEFLATVRVEAREPAQDYQDDRYREITPAARWMTQDTFEEHLNTVVGGHYTLDFNVEQTTLVATLNEDAVPTHLRRYIQPHHRLFTGTPAITRTDVGLFVRAEDGTLVPYTGACLVPRWNSYPPILTRLVADITSYRDQIRAELRRRLPGAAAERLATQVEQTRQQDHRNAALNRYAAWRSKIQPVSENVIGTLPFVPNGVRASLRWGIEIETGAGRDLSGTPRGWDSKDDGSLESAYDNEWVDPEDCPEYSYSHQEPTIEVEHGSGYIDVPNPDFEDPRYCSYCGENGHSYDSDDCVELVSPILTSMHSNGLQQICADLEFAPRTESAGIHVHVEAKDLTVRQIGQLVLSYDKIEHLIEASYDREERGYCKRRSSSEVLEIARSARTEKQVQNMRKGDRYVTLNLQALDAHGTVEFRAMGPKYNYDHLVRWAMFCREMVNCAKNGATAKDWGKVDTWNGVLDMFAKYGEEYNMAIDHALATIEDEMELEAV
jgi:hypothetical protein